MLLLCICTCLQEAGSAYFLRQIDGGLANACGTIALLHSIINARDELHLDASTSTSPAMTFFRQTRDQSAEDRGLYLDTYDAIASLHNSLVSRGDTAPLSSEDVKHHYVAFVREAGNGHRIIELDGFYRTGPVFHEMIPQAQDEPAIDDLLKSAVTIIRDSYLSRIGDSLAYSILLLTPLAQT